MTEDPLSFALLTSICYDFLLEEILLEALLMPRGKNLVESSTVSCFIDVMVGIASTAEL